MVSLLPVLGSGLRVCADKIGTANVFAACVFVGLSLSQFLVVNEGLGPGFFESLKKMSLENVMVTRNPSILGRGHQG